MFEQGLYLFIYYYFLIWLNSRIKDRWVLAKFASPHSLTLAEHVVEEIRVTYFCDQCGVLDCEKSAARRLLDRAKRNVMDLGGTTELRAGAELYEVVLSSLCAHVVPLGDDVVEQTTLPPNDDRGAVRIVPVSVNTDMRRRND